MSRINDIQKRLDAHNTERVTLDEQIAHALGTEVQTFRVHAPADVSWLLARVHQADAIAEATNALVEPEDMHRCRGKDAKHAGWCAWCGSNWPCKTASVRRLLSEWEKTDQ